MHVCEHFIHYSYTITNYPREMWNSLSRSLAIHSLFAYSIKNYVKLCAASETEHGTWLTELKNFEYARTTYSRMNLSFFLTVGMLRKLCASNVEFKFLTEISAERPNTNAQEFNAQFNEKIQFTQNNNSGHTLDGS